MNINEKKKNEVISIESDQDSEIISTDESAQEIKFGPEPRQICHKSRDGRRDTKSSKPIISRAPTIGKFVRNPIRDIEDSDDSFKILNCCRCTAKKPLKPY